MSFRISCFLFLIVLLQSCAVESVYLSNSTNTPNLTNKFDGNANALLGLNHAELQGAFSPIKNLGIFFNGYKAIQNSSQLMDFALGYYHQISKTNIYYDIYAGVGFGQRVYLGSPWDNLNKTMYSDLMNIENIHTVFSKQFLQASVYYFWAEKFEVSITGQVANLNFNSMQIDLENYYNYSPSTTSVLFNQTFKNLDLFNFTTAATIKYKFAEHFKIFSQLMTNTTINPPYQGNYNNIYFNARSFCLNLGVQFIICRKTSGRNT